MNTAIARDQNGLPVHVHRCATGECLHDTHGQSYLRIGNDDDGFVQFVNIDSETDVIEMARGDFARLYPERLP